MRETPRNAHDLVGAVAVGVELDTALGAAEGQVDERALPRHQRGESFHLGVGNGRMEPNAAFVGAQDVVVLDPVALKDAVRIVVHANREVHLHDGLGLRKDGVQLGGQIDELFLYGFAVSVGTSVMLAARVVTPGTA